MVTHWFIRIFQHKVVSPKNRPDDNQELHAGKIPSNATSRAIRERVESLLNDLFVLFKPPFRSEGIHVFTPDISVTVNSVGRNTQDSAFGEEVSGKMKASFRDQARKTDSRCGMDTKSLVYHRFKVWQFLDLFVGGNRVIVIAQCFV